MVICSGRKGKSIKGTIIISDVDNHFEGISAEYRYIEDKYGRSGVDW